MLVPCGSKALNKPSLSITCLGLSLASAQSGSLHVEVNLYQFKLVAFENALEVMQKKPVLSCVLGHNCYCTFLACLLPASYLLCVALILFVHCPLSVYCTCGINNCMSMSRSVRPQSLGR